VFAALAVQVLWIALFREGEGGRGGYMCGKMGWTIYLRRKSGLE